MKLHTQPRLGREDDPGPKNGGRLVSAKAIYSFEKTAFLLSILNLFKVYKALFQTINCKHATLDRKFQPLNKFQDDPQGASLQVATLSTTISYKGRCNSGARCKIITAPCNDYRRGSFLRVLMEYYQFFHTYPIF